LRLFSNEEAPDEESAPAVADGEDTDVAAEDADEALRTDVAGCEISPEDDDDR
jgi:hypothetical protein